MKFRHRVLVAASILVTAALSVGACQQKKSESREKSFDPQAAPSSGAKTADLDPHGDSCKLDWNQHAEGGAGLSLKENFKFVYDFCTEIKKLTWPGGGGTVDLRGLLKLNVPMDFEYWQGVFARRNIEIKSVDLRLQIVLDGQFDRVKFGPALTVDTTVGIKAAFAGNTDLCNTSVNQFFMTDLMLKSPIGNLALPGNALGFVNDQAFKPGGQIHTIVQKNLEGWYLGWLNDVFGGIRKSGCSEPLLIKQEFRPDAKP